MGERLRTSTGVLSLSLYLIAQKNRHFLLLTSNKVALVMTNFFGGKLGWDTDQGDRDRFYTS